MNKWAALLFCVAGSVAVVGCYTTTQLAVEDFPQVRPSEDVSVVVRLNDGALLEVTPYHHIMVLDSTEFLFGVGAERKTGRTFKGKIPIDQVDSIYTASANPESRGYLICWTKKGTSIVFFEEDYLWIKSNSETGFWCTGVLQRAGQESLFKGPLEKTQVSEMKTQKFDVLKTALLASPLLLLFVIPKDWKPFEWINPPY